MAFTDITSTDSVRAALGVSEKEIKDVVLLNPIYTTRLTEAIYDMHPRMLQDFVTAAALTTKSEDQERFVNIMQTWAAMHIAKQCLGAVAMFAPRTIRDDRSELTRSDDPYKQLRKDITETLPILRMRLRTLYPRINPEASVPPAVERLSVLAAPLGANPITG